MTLRDLLAADGADLSAPRVAALLQAEAKMGLPFWALQQFAATPQEQAEFADPATDVPRIEAIFANIAAELASGARRLSATAPASAIRDIQRAMLQEPRPPAPVVSRAPLPTPTAEAKGVAQPQEGLQDIQGLCGGGGLFDMPRLRVRALDLAQRGVVPLSKSEQAQLSAWPSTVAQPSLVTRRQVCDKLREALKQPLPTPRAPTVATLQASASEFPAWAVDPVPIEFMTDPMVTSSERAYSAPTLARIHADPINRRPIAGPQYKSWNLQQAIRDWIWQQTGYPWEEIERAEREAKAVEEQKDRDREQKERAQALGAADAIIALLESLHVPHLEQDRDMWVRFAMWPDIADRLRTIHYVVKYGSNVFGVVVGNFLWTPQAS